MPKGEFLPTLDRDSFFRNATPVLSKGLAHLTGLAGVTEEAFALACVNDPQGATRLARELEEFMEIRFRMGLSHVYDSMWLKANAGDVAAAKLLVQRFDERFIEKQQVNLKHEIELPTLDEFRQLARARLGEEQWNAIEEAAKRRGLRSGVVGEQYLPGGEMEDYEPPILEARLIEEPEKPREAREEIPLEEAFD